MTISVRIALLSALFVTPASVFLQPEVGTGFVPQRQEQEQAAEEDIEFEQPFHALIRNVRGDFRLGESGEIVQVSFPGHQFDEDLPDPTEDEIIEAISSLNQLRHLESVSLRHGRASDAIVQAVAELDGLKKLVLSDSTKLTDEGIRAVAQMESLEYLYITCFNLVLMNDPVPEIKITGESLQDISTMKNLRQLFFVGIPGVGDEHLAPLANMKQLTTLQLGIGANKITDAGIAHLAGLTNLERLGIQMCDIGDQTLEQIRQMTRLENLMLSTVEEGGQVFSADMSMQVISNLPSLKVLNFGKTEMSCDQIQQLLNDREFEMFIVGTTSKDAEFQKQLVDEFGEKVRHISINEFHNRDP